MRSIILCVVLLLAARETPAPSHVEMVPAVKLETRALYWGDSWSYEGEVRPGVRAMRGRTPLNPWALICNDGYCAHGYGDLGMLSVAACAIFLEYKHLSFRRFLSPRPSRRGSPFP